MNGKNLIIVNKSLYGIRLMKGCIYELNYSKISVRGLLVNCLNVN